MGSPSSLFFSHISPVVLSVIVPSPLSVNDWLAPFCRSPSLPLPYAVVCPVLSRRGVALQAAKSALQVAKSALHVSTPSGSAPPLSAALMVSVSSVMKACMAASSPFDGHMPPPFVSAVIHFSLNFASHFE